VCGIILFGDWVNDQYAKTTPEIGIVDSDPASPFSFPFSVRNASAFFSMTGVKWSCNIRHLEFGIGNVANDLTVGSGAVHQISPSTSENYGCGIQMRGLEIRSLIMVVSIDYNILGRQRHHDVPFTWIASASRPRWIEGDKINR
jgi:hypothetical protein